MFELAATLGSPICELGDRLTTEELLAWRIWLSEPRGDARADYHAAQICASVDKVIYSFAGKPFPGRLRPYLLRFRTSTPEDTVKTNAMRAMALFPGVIPQEVTDNVLRDSDSSAED